MLGQHLQEALGQTVLIENRAGALGSIGAQEVARSAPDGYTLLMGTNTTQASNVAMLKNLPYDPARDFAPIIRTITTAMVLLVKPDFPAKDLPQFMEYAKSHQNITAGYGSGASQISNAQLQSRGGMSIISASYRGVPQAVTDVIAGVIDLAFADFSVAIPQMQGGTLRGIGVTSPKRNELTPTLPALAEAMPGFEATIWYGLLAPANTPEPIVNRLYTESAKIPGDARGQGEARQCRNDRLADAAGRIRRLCPQRDHAMDGGGQGRRHRSEIARRPDGRGRLPMQVTAPVGILGLGLIGTAFSERLVGADIAVIGFDSDTSRCEKLRANGGMVAASPRELASQCGAIVIAVYDCAQAEALFSDLESARCPPGDHLHDNLRTCRNCPSCDTRGECRFSLRRGADIRHQRRGQRRHRQRAGRWRRRSHRCHRAALGYSLPAQRTHRKNR